MVNRRLTRSSKGKLLLGVFSGLGGYFKVDPVILRLVYVALIIVSTQGFTLILFYFAAAIIMPKESG